jgi:predicted ATPase
MLTSLTLTNWKSFGETRNELPLAPLTLLVGPNGSGKSNALDALRFLQGAALDFPLGDVLRGRWEGQREIWPPIRGQVVEAARTGMKRFEIGSRWKLEAGNVAHTIAVDTTRDALLDSESLLDPQSSPVFTTGAAYVNGAPGRDSEGRIRAAFGLHKVGPALTNLLDSTHSLLNARTFRPVKADPFDPEHLTLLRDLRSALGAIAFVAIDPARMRDYRPMFAPSLGASGENTSAVLRSASPELRADIVDWVSELCAPKVDDIGFDETQLQEVMLYLHEGGHRISARSVSDGTLRFLGLVTALLTAKPRSVIVLEEPDVGLHPARIHLLARLLEQATSRGGVQVIATTHSPTLLAHLSPESLANVVALGRDDDGVTVCQRVGDLAHFATLRDSAQLDHLVSTGWLERAL